MRNIIIILFILLVSPLYADTVTMPQYSTGGSVTATNQNERFNLLANEINGGLNNENSKAGFRFHEILGALPAAGNQGRTVFLTADNTLYFDDGLTFRAVGVLSNTQTWTGVNTFSGVVNFDAPVDFDSTVVFDDEVDLNAKLTADTNEIEGSNFDINGGTMDEVNVDGATSLGMLFTNDASNDLSQLGAQGTTGQFLQSAGAGANPTWGSPGGVIFSWSGVDNSTTADFGMYIGTDGSIDVDTIGANYQYFVSDVAADPTILNFRMTKLSGLDTVTIRARMATQGGHTCTLTVDIGGQNADVTRANNATFAWATPDDIDISSLTTGTTYDGVVQLRSGNAAEDCYVSAVTLYAN